MPDSTNTSKEFTIFGISGLWRGGFLTAALTLMTAAIIYLWIDNRRLNQMIVDKQDELYKNTIDILRDPIRKMNDASNKVDTISTKVDSVATHLLQKAQEGGVKR